MKFWCVQCLVTVGIWKANEAITIYKGDALCEPCLEERP